MSTGTLFSTKSKIFSKVLLVMMTALSVIILYPFFFMIMTSLKPPMEIFNFMRLPSTLYWQNYIAVFMTGNIIRATVNTVIIVFATILVGVLTSSLASHPLGRYNQRIFTVIYFFFLSGMIFSSQAYMLPQFQLIKFLGLMNKISALIFLNAAQMIPMAILVYTGFLKTIPISLEESAIIDGCGRLRMFFSVIFPLLKPATITVIATNIFGVLNDFINPLLYLQSENKRTLILTIYRFQGEHSSDLGPIFAFCTMFIIPIILLFFLLQKYLISGLMSGAIKG